MTDGCTRIPRYRRLRCAGAFPRWWRAAVLGAALALASPALAASGQGREAYALAPGDRITVTVFGQPQLSGEMTIDGSGNIVLPFVGPVRVGRLSVLQAQNLIQKRLADGFLKQPLVSVGVSKLRPLYVLGDVRAPGAYPFHYGSTVQSAVALAGGFGAPGLAQSAAVAEYLSAEERVRQLFSEQLVLRVREARLEAQRDGKPTFAPPDPPSSASKRALATLVANEQAMLTSQTTILAAQINLLNAQKPRLKQQIEAINAQIAAVRNRLEFVKREELRSVQLLKQGLGVRGPEVQMKLDESNAEMNLGNLAAQLSRSQMDLGNLELEIQKVEAAFKKQTLDELQKVRERLAELNVALPSARAIRNVRLEQAEGAAATGETRSIDITRTRDGRVVVIKGSDTTPLQPGDIVDIKTVLPDGLLASQSPAG